MKDLIKTIYSNNFGIFILSLTTRAVTKLFSPCNVQSETTNEKKKEIWSISRLPLSILPIFLSHTHKPNYLPWFPPNQVQWIKNNSESPIWLSERFYVGQTLKYIYNVTMVINNFILLIVHKDTSEELTCSFYYNIR